MKEETFEKVKAFISEEYKDEVLALIEDLDLKILQKLRKPKSCDAPWAFFFGGSQYYLSITYRYHPETILFLISQRKVPFYQLRYHLESTYQPYRM